MPGSGGEVHSQQFLQIGLEASRAILGGQSTARVANGQLLANRRNGPPRCELVPHWFGKWITKLEPLPTVLCTFMRPPCALMIARTRLKPNPSPRCERLLSPR